jgi:hypothetical protein
VSERRQKPESRERVAMFRLGRCRQPVWPGSHRRPDDRNHSKPDDEVSDLDHVFPPITEMRAFQRDFD